jgi:hypothetical protein
VEKKKPSKIKFYGVGILFLFIVSVVEIIKNLGVTQTYAQTVETNNDPSALIVLPIFSIAIVLLLAIPRKNF